MTVAPAWTRTGGARQAIEDYAAMVRGPGVIPAVVSHQERTWASATFSGQRVQTRIEFSGLGAGCAARVFADGFGAAMVGSAERMVVDAEVVSLTEVRERATVEAAPVWLPEVRERATVEVAMLLLDAA